MATQETTTEKVEKTEKKPDPVDRLSVTRHKLKIGRRELAYTATCGTMVLKEEAEKEGKSEGEKARARYEQNCRDAIAADAFGSPVYVRDGEAFWGQDRLDLFEDAVRSGRPGFRSDAA